MNTKESKVAVAIANAIEDHYFNPASVARYLADQPHYTIDRVMELVVWIIEKEARKHEADWNNGTTSEGLFLAKQLDIVVDKLTKKYDWKNLKLPQEQKAVVKKEQPKRQGFGYIEDKDPFQ
jgi:hypothetical protein